MTPRVYYPLWAKALGLLGLPALVVVAVYVALMPIFEEDLSPVLQVVYPLLGLAVLYQCVIGFRCLRYLNTVIELHDTGIRVIRGDSSREYQWRELGVVEYGFATTNRIVAEDGSTVAYLSDGLPNLDILVQAIRATRRQD
mgnify:CR=1 FL=1